MPKKAPTPPEVADTLRQVAQDVAALPGPTIGALLPLLGEAEKELSADLAAWLAKAPKGDERYTAQAHRNALLTIRGSLEEIRALHPQIYGALVQGGQLAASYSTKHVAEELARWGDKFGHSIRPGPLSEAAVLAAGNKTLLNRYRTSAARYALGMEQDIRNQLAIGLVRGETIDQLTNRLVRLGGPKGQVALRGILGQPGAVAEEISEGLFKRYRHWAERLARTEVINAYNEHTMALLDEVAAKDPGIRYRWDASLDSRICQICQRLDALLAEPGTSFAGYPRPPAHPNCRCTVVAWHKAWTEQSYRETEGGEKAPGSDVLDNVNPLKITPTPDGGITIEIPDKPKKPKKPKPAPTGDTTAQRTGALEDLVDDLAVKTAGQGILEDISAETTQAQIAREAAAKAAKAAAEAAALSAKIAAEQAASKAAAEAAHKAKIEALANAPIPKPLKGPPGKHYVSVMETATLEEEDDVFYIVKGKKVKATVTTLKEDGLWLVLETGEIKFAGPTEVYKLEDKPVKPKAPKKVPKAPPVYDSSDPFAEFGPPKPIPGAPVPAIPKAPPKPAKVKPPKVTIGTPAAPGTSVTGKEFPGTQGLDWGEAEYADWKTGLTRDELNAVVTYKGHAYSDINRAFRTGQPLGVYQKTADDLDKALAAKPLPIDLKTFRGEKMPANVLASLSPGDVLVDKAYRSSSTKRSTAESFAGSSGVLWEIDLPKGTPGAYVSWRGDQYDGGESEYLLPRGSRMRIKEITKDPQSGRTIIRAQVE